MKPYFFNLCMNTLVNEIFLTDLFKKSNIFLFFPWLSVLSHSYKIWDFILCFFLFDISITILNFWPDLQPYLLLQFVLEITLTIFLHIFFRIVNLILKFVFQHIQSVNFQLCWKKSFHCFSNVWNWQLTKSLIVVFLLFVLVLMLNLNLIVKCHNTISLDHK